TNAKAPGEPRASHSATEATEGVCGHRNALSMISVPIQRGRVTAEATGDFAVLNLEQVARMAQRAAGRQYRQPQLDARLYAELGRCPVNSASAPVRSQRAASSSVPLAAGRSRPTASVRAIMASVPTTSPRAWAMRSMSFLARLPPRGAMTFLIC